MDYTIDTILARLLRRKQTRFGIVKEIDLFGEADWNPMGFHPSALVDIFDTKIVESVACRFGSVSASGQNGFWWPPEVGQYVIIVFENEIDTPIIVGYLWPPKVDIPDEATEHNILIKHGGHYIEINKADDGELIRLKMDNGIEILLDKSNNKIRVNHPSGTYIEISDDGSMLIKIVGNKTEEVVGDSKLDIVGDYSIDVEGGIEISAAKSVVLHSDVSITLETLQQVAPLINQLTHPVCYITGAPIGGSTTVSGGS